MKFSEWCALVTVIQKGFGVWVPLPSAYGDIKPLGGQCHWWFAGHPFSGCPFAYILSRPLVSCNKNSKTALAHPQKLLTTTNVIGGLQGIHFLDAPSPTFSLDPPVSLKQNSKTAPAHPQKLFTTTSPSTKLLRTAPAYPQKFCLKRHQPFHKSSV